MAAVTHVGLDIGSTSIRAVETVRSKERPFVNNFGQALLPDGAVAGGVVVDDKAVISALRHLWSVQRFKTKSVVLGVTHPQVVVREVDVSNVPAHQMRQSLPFQVRDVLPLPVDDAVLDFWPLEGGAKGGTVHGLLIAAPKEAVMKTVRAVEQAGLFVARVDLASFAALRAAAHLAHDTEAVLDLGATSTMIVVHTDGTPQFVRTIPRGGAEITKLIATRLGVSAAEAEGLKCRVGLLRPESEDGTEFAEVADIVEAAIRPLISEVRSSFNYFTGSKPNEQIDRLALVGGAALLPGIIDRLARDLDVATYLADPLRRVGTSRRGGGHDALGRIRSSAAVSVGLTLGAA